MNLFRRYLLAVGAAALLGFSSAASAVPFTIPAMQFLPGTGYGIDASESSGTLLDVRFSTSAFALQSFDLNAIGQSTSFTVGTVDLEETNAQGGVNSNETDNLGVSAILTFTAPTGVAQTVIANGMATAGNVSDAAVDYILDWSPVTILFGNGGAFQLSLNDLVFSGTGTQFQTATVTLTSLSQANPPTNVPEPATIALLAIGMGWIASTRRQRAKT